MVALLITLIMGLAATLLYLLAQHKEEIWEDIKFKE
jgi:hypothetical protein